MLDMPLLSIVSSCMILKGNDAVHQQSSFLANLIMLLRGIRMEVASLQEDGFL